MKRKPALRGISVDGSTTLKLNDSRNRVGDYTIQAYKEGKRYPEADYFSDDWVDAVKTFNHMTGATMEPAEGDVWETLIGNMVLIVKINTTLGFLWVNDTINVSPVWNQLLRRVDWTKKQWLEYALEKLT